MSLRIDWADDKRLFLDNILVSTTKDSNLYFRINITPRGASVCCYCVPGRLDIYSFDWVPGTPGVGERVAYFSDMRNSLNKALKLFKKDLKKARVKKLIKEAKTQFPRSYLNNLLEVLS